MTTQRIIHGATGQVLRFVPPSRVTSCTFALEDLTQPDDGADRVLASGAATVASWSITTSATSGATQADAAKMSTASTTGATVAAPAQIVGADGSRELFTVRAVATNSYIAAETDLAGTYAAGSTVYGIEITAAVPNDVAADEDLLEQERPIRVVWTYTLDGVPYKVQQPVQLVRHTSAMPDTGEVLRLVRDLYPDLPGRLAEGASLERVVVRLADRVANDMRAAGIRPEQFLAGPQGVEVLLARVLVQASEHGYAPGSTEPGERYRLEKRREYTEMLERLKIGEPGEGVLETVLASDTAGPNPSRTMRGPTLAM